MLTKDFFVNKKARDSTFSFAKGTLMISKKTKSATKNIAIFLTLAIIRPAAFLLQEKARPSSDRDRLRFWEKQ